MTDVQSNWFVRSRLKTRQIVLLVHLYEQRSVLRAAHLAGMTQPAASKMLSEVEGTLGIKLFERHARGVQPTWYGEILVRHARSALAEIGRAQDEIESFKAGLSGRARIGTVTNPGINLIPTAIAAIKQSHPRLLISVEMDASRPLVSRLLEGQLDYVIGRILDRHDAGELNFEPLFDEPHVVVVRADHPFAHRRRLTIAALMQQGWILQGADSVFRARFDAMLREQGVEQPANMVETASLSFAIALLQMTDMIAVLPEQAVLAYCKAGLLKILPVPVGVKMDYFGIITRRRHPLSPGAEIMLKALRDTAQKLYPSTAG